MKTLIEIHVLQNFAPSNLNRDDTGAPKDAIFGGFRRARVSSQCLKRSVRRHFAELAAKQLLNSGDLAWRTKRVLEVLTGMLVEQGRARAEAAEKVQNALGAVGLTIKDDGKTQYLVFLGQHELTRIAEIIQTNWDSIVVGEAAEPEEKKSGKSKKKDARAANPELKKALDKVFDGGKALDIALFGRMLADMPDKNQDAACQVAHAISTHTVEREFDYYTAVDDLKPDDTAGADMIGTIEFNSACFYRYALVDWEKFVANLQQDHELARKGLRAFLEGFVTAEPTGKQNTFAAHNPPEFISVAVRRETAPRNLANAFEAPVRAAGQHSLTQTSAQALVQKAQALQSAFGGAHTTFMLNLTGMPFSEPGVPVSTLEELLGNTLAAVKE